MGIKKRIITFLIALIFTFTFFRIALHLSPLSNFGIGGYNIHHLFSGSIILMIAIVAFVCELRSIIFVIFAGIGSALVLDEIIYLIATDGSDLAYLTPVSLIGALVLIALMIIAVTMVYFIKKLRGKVT